MNKNMMIKTWAAAVVATMALAAPALVQAAGLEQFKAFVANTKSAKGEFTQQQVKMENGKATVSKTASGSFLFARPGKFIWTYTKPYEQLLQADGEKLYIYDKDLNQVTIKKLGDALGSSPAAILFGSSDLEKNFTLKEVGTKEGMDWLEAIPKSKDSNFDHIGIGMKDGVPMALELRDSFGKVSLVTLSKVEKNPVVKPEQFKFTVPKDADIFQQ
jgi:outer membrane lipoprotein carrier protein